MVIAKCRVTPAIAALAGRRIDVSDATIPRFPLLEVQHVYNKLLYRFRRENIQHLVCSAACGADILALEAARELAIPATVVLPFSPDIFREVSVTDRPGAWGKRFDHLVQEASDRGRLIDLQLEVSDENAFTVTNHRIIESVLDLRFTRKLAFVVWDGRSRGEGDSTAEFLKIALSHGLEKRCVMTTGKSCSEIVE
ncbi:hypothetical protein Geob_2719 [Geotalea daltonii FRC-32]|uniref:DUF1273 family protein n=1 Tax=Geotalea daltonii (strain DSM 22248 / JCM 15807 / FRC-32) TaxID=316067 RepID=B9M1I7_GEODF|nr:hypothetical protein [Geotalea daltonii]ACM21069.1 hypothetical protein Geob_2719 [Geotalea daltonii FRC-32]